MHSVILPFFLSLRASPLNIGLLTSFHTSMVSAVTAKGSQSSRNSKGKTTLPPDRSAFDTLRARIFILQFANLTQHWCDSAVFQENHGLWCTFFILSSYALRINALSVCLPKQLTIAHIIYFAMLFIDSCNVLYNVEIFVHSSKWVKRKS